MNDQYAAIRASIALDEQRAAIAAGTFDATALQRFALAQDAARRARETADACAQLYRRDGASEIPCLLRRQAE